MKPNLRILVVDDDAFLRQLIASMYRAQAFVSMASSGNEAIEFLRHNAVDLVLSDVCMPDGDGIDLVDWIQTLKQDKPVVVFVTGQSSISIEDAIAKGVHSVVSKPFRMKVLNDIVSEITDRKFGPTARVN